MPDRKRRNDCQGFLHVFESVQGVARIVQGLAEIIERHREIWEERVRIRGWLQQLGERENLALSCNKC